MTRMTAIIVGAGHRAMLYASYANEHPDELAIVGVADLIPRRREQAASLFGIPPKHCFETAEQLAGAPRFADVVINGTMDRQHVPTALPLLEAGYDMLLEKPFATSEAEMWQLAHAARRHGRKVAICHVLRYAPFYAAIRQKVIEGAIGEILNVQAAEHVSYHHVSVGFVRGKWNRHDFCGSGMLMSKSCHDLDVIAWMKSGVRPIQVASFGSNQQFRPEKAPTGAGTRCLVDCPIEADCLYSARKHFIDHPDRWAFYVWDSLEHMANPTIEDKIASLQTSPYGRCAWKTDMNVVDHQSVLIEFADGATATLNMIGGAAKPSRTIHLIGTCGEIRGCMEESKATIYTPDLRPGHETAEEVVDLNLVGDTVGAGGGHGGGDMRLMADFLRFVHGKPRSISSTDLEDSISGHLIGFSAEQAREEGRTVQIPAERWR